MIFYRILVGLALGFGLVTLVSVELEAYHLAGAGLCCYEIRRTP